MEILFHKSISLFSSSNKYTEKNDINKFLLIKVSRNYLPKEITNAKKLGFPVPLNNWIKDEQIEDMLLGNSSRSKMFYNISELKKILQMKNDKNFDFAGKKVWMLVNIELWMRQKIG